jgi:hypothetical protein
MRIHGVSRRRLHPRIRAVAAFSPVTDLLALGEFAGQEHNPLARRLAPANATESLADRPVWISIGNADARGDTRKAVAFVEALRGMAAARKLLPRVTARLLDTPGHTGVPESHDEAALWMRGSSHEPVTPHPLPSSSLPPSPGKG